MDKCKRGERNKRKHVISVCIKSMHPGCAVSVSWKVEREIEKYLDNIYHWHNKRV